MPEDFLSFTLRFVCDGRTLKTLRFDYGDSFDFSIFPSLTEQSGSYPVWDRTDLTDLRFDTVVTAEYTAYRASLQSDAQRADGRSVFFVEGEFNETDTLTAAAQTPEDVSARFEPRLEKLLSQQKAQKHNRTQEIVIQINQRLEQGFRDTGIGAQSIAEEMGVSAAYLRKQYLTEAGISIGDKLNQLRMDEASRLLLETDQPIESIARQIGVENTKYFFVLFKKFKGMTPRQFRCKAETPLL